MFWFIPIEPLEERYTTQMYKWVTEILREKKIQFATIKGKPLSNTTQGGQFLNWTSTTAYKAEQTRKIAKLFHEGKVNDGDIFFVGDIWFPGIEAIAYLRDALKIDCKIYGINYAGVFDKTDLIRPMLHWGSYQEAAWYSMCDQIFVGSEYHKNLIIEGMEKWVPDSNALHCAKTKITVTGLVWDEEDVIAQASAIQEKDTRPLIIWPHRLSPEKNVEGLYQTVEAMQGFDIHWLITSSRVGQIYQTELPQVEFRVVSKSDYYGLLEQATLMYSTSYHENFGYTVREATALATPVLCPRRADYPEMILTQDNLYSDQEEAIRKIKLALIHDLPVATLKEMGGFRQMLEIMQRKEYDDV